MDDWSVSYRIRRVVMGARLIVAGLTIAAAVGGALVSSSVSRLFDGPQVAVASRSDDGTWSRLAGSAARGADQPTVGGMALAWVGPYSADATPQIVDMPAGYGRTGVPEAGRLRGGRAVDAGADAVSSSQGEGGGSSEGGSSAQPGPLAEYTSRAYVIRTDLPRETAAEYARHMDAVFAEYTQRFSSFRARNRKPMPLYLFRTRQGYLNYLAGYGVDASNSGGMFVYTQRVQGLFIFVEGRSRADTLSTLQHEGFHQFAFKYIGPSLPVWVNEGMAQYFEDGIMVRNRMVVGIPNASRLATVKAAMANEQLFDFDQLLSITGSEWSESLRSDPRRASLLYAQSWSVVYFLVHANNGRYRAPFEQFLRLISSGRHVRESFERAFGSSDTRPFEARWAEYTQDVQPDPINQAVERMEFLGRAMQRLMAAGQSPPEDIEALQKVLVELRYRAWRSNHGVRVVYDSTDETMYEYPLPGGGTRSFEILESPGEGLPPRIAARGLKPEPTLTWVREPDGDIRMDFEYR